MTRPEPRVSVLTVVRDGAAFIRGALASVREQDYGSWEHVVVDDGSDDDTAAIVRDQARDDARIRLVRQGKEGLVAARNRAVRESRGELLAILDADDLSLPGRLERQVAFLDEHPEHALVGGDEVAVMAEEGRSWLVVHPRSDGDLRKSWIRGHVFTNSATMVRRSAVEEVGGYDPACPRGDEDHDLWVRVAARRKVANLALPVVVRRYHGAQVTRRGFAREISVKTRQKLSAMRRLGLPAWRAWELVFPLFSVLPGSLKRGIRKVLGHHRAVPPGVAAEVEEFCRRIGAEDVCRALSGGAPSVS